MLHVRLIHHAVTNRLPQQQVLSSLHSVKKTATHKKFSQCSFLRSFKTLLHTNKPDTQTKSIQSHIMFLPNQFFTRSSFRATHTRYLGSSALRNDKEEEKAADCVVAQIRSPFLQKTDDDENKSPTLLQRLESFLVKHFGKHTIEAPDGFNRWLAMPPIFAVQASIASVYSWSVFNAPLSMQLGVFAQAADDWDVSTVLPIFSVGAVTLGFTAFFLGQFIDRVGPRAIATAVAGLWGGGLAITGLGAHMHLLPLMYLGFGLVGGAGWGLAYVMPVSALLAWFPDKRGLALGLGMTAFGTGTMAAVAGIEKLMHHFSRLPDYLGQVADVTIVAKNGRYFVDNMEVMVASANDALQTSGILQDGVYAVGSGDTGVAATFFTLGAFYFTTCMTASRFMKWPQKGWVPPQHVSVPQNELTGDSKSNPDSLPQSKAQECVSLTAPEAVQHKQFYLLWGIMFGQVCSGLAVISTAKTLINECMAPAMPLVVTSAFCASFVGAVSAANMLGRLGWGIGADHIGRKTTLYAFGLGTPICLALPYVIETAMVNPGYAPLTIFCGGTLFVVSTFGGLFAVMPAYVADVFGPKNAGAIMGRILTGYTAAAMVGPGSSAYQQGLTDLMNIVDPTKFETRFGAPITQAQELIEAKTVTISNLMEIMPSGVVDPTASLYTSSLYMMATTIGMGVLCNAMIRPLSKNDKSKV